MRQLFHLAKWLVVTLSMATTAHAETINQSWLGVAIGGYDPVAYFTENRPVQGDSDIALNWKGAEWRFADAGNRALFEAAPSLYAPQYGGYCAYAVANGYTAGIDPDAWAIVDNRLYLIYSARIERIWRSDIDGHLARSEANWPAIRAKLAD